MTALRMLREMGTTYWGRGRSRNRAPEVTLRNARRDTMAAQDNVHIAQDGFAAMSWTSRRTPVRSMWTLRSEEHTSELQSPYDLVCRLLLEKKKKYEDN